MKTQILVWSQSFLNYFDLKLKNGLPLPVLKAGSSGKLTHFLSIFNHFFLLFLFVSNKRYYSLWEGHRELKKLVS